MKTYTGDIIRMLIWCSMPCICLLTSCSSRAQNSTGKKDSVRFIKHVLTNDFISEGATAADVNKDGKMDVLAGTYWFEAPDWKQHAIIKGEKFPVGGYSNSFLNFSQDVNGDGWMDMIKIGFPFYAAYWYENPQNKSGYWKEHLVFHSVGNESPVMTDVDGDGKLDLLCNDPKNKKVIWVSPPANQGDTGWTRHIISNDTLRGTHHFTHGLGLGDINGDKRKDVMIKEGWWEAPKDRKQTDWTFHPAAFGDECAEMYAMDLDEDGDADVITSSAHDYGIWWFEQVKGKDSVSWKRHLIDSAFSESHGLMLADINNDGHPDLITGKRWWAHNGGDRGANEPSVLYWYEYIPGKQPRWIPHYIDNESGVGLHVIVQDMNNDKLPDIVIGNKKGVFVFEQSK